ncbi:filamentous hemagglutinin N-terminal domain-containing protein [Scytonema sp. NUACC26]|uniref:two-partner secretion domain-containing protein n=1 Tax=Scytonema sp. NUACC26 TaxID=3140176 RepID=UPI0034DC31D7
MKAKRWLGYWQLRFVGLLTSIGVSIFADKALAQSTPSNIQADDTLGIESSQIIQNFQGQPIEVITGGATRSINLFHSFKEFNVREGRGVYFFSPNDNIQNILTRVTGGNRSEILGVLGTFGNSVPNLFLINPNGIIFGESARLNVQGSFVATTANGVQFGQGFFSATKPEAPSSLLTINPGALFFNQINQTSSIQNNSGLLRVPNGKSLLLVGGNVSMDGGVALANGGRVELGGLVGVGAVGLNEDSKNLSLSFPENVERSNVFLSKGASVSVLSGGGGAIAINSKNLELREGSTLNAGIAGGLGSPDAKAGDIVINATNQVTFDGINQNGIPSGIYNSVVNQGMGNTGNIRITTGNLSLTNGAILLSGLSGEGKTGDIIINALHNISLDGNTRIINTIAPTGTGSTGNISISARNLSLTNGGNINSSNLGGKGTSGNIAIDTSDVLFIDGGLQQIVSAIASSVLSPGVGNAGAIDINTKNLIINNGGGIDSLITGNGNAGDVTINARDSISLDGNNQFLPSYISSNTGGIGNSGNIKITTKNLSLTNGANIGSETFGRGSAGNISIIASERIFLDGKTTVNPDLVSAISSRVGKNAIGNGGILEISTGNLKLSNNGNISTNSSGVGNAGNVKIEGKEEVVLDSGRIDSSLLPTAQGQGGSIEISTGNLKLSNNGNISVSSSGKGNAGNVRIEAKNEVVSDSGQIDSVLLPSAQGQGGDISINAKKVSLFNNAFLEASSSTKGDAGNIQINSTEKIILNRSSINSSILFAPELNFLGEGNAGKIEIKSPQIFLDNNASITTNNVRKGNAGNISLEASDLFSVTNGSGISSSLGQPGTSAEGKVGTITISAKNVSFTNGAQLQALFYSNSRGESGTISIQATDSISFDGNSSLLTAVAPGASANGSDIKLEANSISIANSSRLSASNLGKGNGGSIRITAKDTVFVDSGSIDSGVGSTGEGNGGEIDIKTSKMFFNNGAQLSTESLGQGNAGNIKVSADSFTLDRNSSILALNTPSVVSSTNLSGGNITLQIADRLLLRNNSDISTQASNNANGGNIDITASAIIAFDDSDLFAFAQQGKGGNITLNTPAYFGFSFNPASSQIKPSPSNNFLNGNNRADINATGAISSGNTFIPDTSYIQNNLAELVQTQIDTNALIANSCITRSGKQENTFTITGSGGLPNRPGDVSVSIYPTGDIRNIQTENVSRPWQKDDPIVEPQNVYYLPSGQLVLSRECSQ